MLSQNLVILAALRTMDIQTVMVIITVVRLLDAKFIVKVIRYYSIVMSLSDCNLNALYHLYSSDVLNMPQKSFMCCWLAMVAQAT